MSFLFNQHVGIPSWNSLSLKLWLLVYLNSTPYVTNKSKYKYWINYIILLNYIFQLDEVEYALPASEAPTLAEALSAEDDELDNRKLRKENEDPGTCSALQADFLQAVSQQLTQANVCIRDIYFNNQEHGIHTNYNGFLYWTTICL